MRGRRWVMRLLSSALVLTPVTAGAQETGRALVERVAAAMGGADRVMGVHTLLLHGSGDAFRLGQAATPEAGLPRVAVTARRHAIDFVNRRWALDEVRERRGPDGTVTSERRRTAYDAVAFDMVDDTTARRAAARDDADRADELLQHPIGYLQLALAPGAHLSIAAGLGGTRSLRMEVAGFRFDMTVDTSTMLPLRIARAMYHPVLGDIVVESHFADWRLVDSVRVPMHVSRHIDGRWTVLDIRIDSARVNAGVGDLAAPSTVLESEPPTPVVVVLTDEVAPGVWHVTGQTHHSVVIEMADHLMLVEAPQGDARSLAVIGLARALRPDKPLTAVVNTHHHFDHAGGLRAAIAEGLTVITHVGNRTFVDSLAARRHHLVADALAARPRVPHIEAIEARHVITHGATVELHHVRGSAHGQAMLMVYLPVARVLVAADLSPAELVANIDRLGLDVERIVPLHGRVMPVSQLRARAAEGRR